MAETGKGVTAGKLASNMQKKITRAQEKVMQKLGKADETRDEVFEEGVVNFNKQMAEGTKLQRDLRAYLTAVKTMHECSKRLQDCLAEMYEPEWFGKEEMDSIAEDTDLLWGDFHSKLVDSALISMDTYMAQFPDIKARIAKRDRKMVDFDSARHHFASIQKGKKKDEVKIAKPVAILEKAAPVWAQGIISAHHVAQTNLTRSQAEEELGRAQKVFEEMNTDLQEELPSLWNSRVGFYVNTFQSVSGLEEKFHREIGKLSKNLFDIMTKLDEQRQAKKGVTKTPSGKSEEAANHNLSVTESASDEPKSPAKLRPGPPVPRPPKPTPLKEVKQDNIIDLFNDAPGPDVNITAPSQQFDGPAVGSLLDIDLDCMQAISFQPAPQAASWDSWEPEQNSAPGEPEQWDEEEEAASAQHHTHYDDDDGQPAVQPYQPPSWDDEDAPQDTQPQQQPSWDDQEAQAPQGYEQPGWDDEGAEAQPAWGDGGGTGGWDEQQSDAQAGWAESDPPQWEGEEPQSADPTPSGAESNAVPAVTNGSSEGSGLPSGVIYKVKAMHDYAATDGDELELKAGDIILVLPFENPDEQDDGWLLGVRESHWQENKNLSAKGVFPENFTQKL